MATLRNFAIGRLRRYPNITAALRRWAALIGGSLVPLSACAAESHLSHAVFRMGVIAYNLFIGFKRLSGPPSWETQTIGTFRWKMLQAGSCAMAGRWSSNFVWRPGSGRSWKPSGGSPLSFAWRPEGNRFAKANGI